MVEKDLIVRCRSRPGKKTVVYSLCSDTVFVGYDPRREFPIIGKSMSLGFLMKVYLKSIGIDASVLERGYSEAVAEMVTRPIDQCKFEEAVFIAKRMIAKATGYRVSVFAVNPLTVIIDGDESLSSFLDMILNAFAAIIRRLSGVNLSAEPKEEHVGEGATRFRTVFEPSNSVPKCHVIRKNGEMQHFSIVERNGWTKVITSGIQMDILRFVSYHPACLQELIGCFDMPRSTLAYNVGKMIEDGLLEFCIDEDGCSYYCSNYNIFLMTSESPKKFSEIDILPDGKGFMDGYLRYVAT